MKFFYLISTIIFTIYGQLILKWRMSFYQDVPSILMKKYIYFSKLIFTDIYILSAFLAAFLASLNWIGVMTKFDVSYAYPLMSLSLVIVFFSSIYFFSESLTLFKCLGLILIILGTVIIGLSKA